MFSRGSSGGGKVPNSNGEQGRKDKTVKKDIPGDPPSKYPRKSNGGVTKLGRQMTLDMISPPPVSNPAAHDSGVSPYKQQSSSEEAAIGSEASGGNVIIEGSGVEVDRMNGELITSSSESVSSSRSTSESVSGTEDISAADISHKEKDSFNAANEFLTTERTFVGILNLLTEDFPRFLERAKGAPVISKKDMDSILGGLPDLKHINEDLLSDLEERIAHWKDFPKIADVLVKRGPNLKLYASYIKDYQKNSMLFDVCCEKYPLFATAVREFELRGNHLLGFKQYLHNPVQRMPQYTLILEKYIKSLDKDDNDYDDTVKGIEIVKDLAQYVDEAARLEHENGERLKSLKSRLPDGTILPKTGRRLIKDGELVKVCRKELQPRYLALMNDCLFCCTYHSTVSSKDLRLSYELPLEDMRVFLSPTEHFYNNEFCLISVTRSFNLVAKSSAERDEWMKALNNAIQDNDKKPTCSTPDEDIVFQLGKEAPLWIPDDRVTMCQLCTADFTLTFRRHHCRSCGKVVCGKCSSGQAPLPFSKDPSSRVCDECYPYLLDEFDKQTDIDPKVDRASMRDRFKKGTPNVSKYAAKRNVLLRLEANDNGADSQISGYLAWREKEKKSWKKSWFEVRNRKLLIFAASEDGRAIERISLKGGQVEDDTLDPQQENVEQWFFRLVCSKERHMMFQTDSLTKAQEWVAALKEAVVVKADEKNT